MVTRVLLPVGFGSIGPTELILILVIVLLIFGASKLPQIGEALGQGIRNFKKATRGDDIEEIPPTRKELPRADADVRPAEVEVVQPGKQTR